MKQAGAAQGASGPRCFAALVGLLALLLCALFPLEARASRPVIEPGREAEIEALFAPHQLGDALAPGWTLHSFQVDRATIVVWLAGPDEQYAKVLLDHPDFGPEDARTTASFDLSVPTPPPGSGPAIGVLLDRVEANDDGRFWVGAPIPREGEGSSARGGALAWLTDGLVLLGLFVLVLFGLVLHRLRDADPWMRWALAGIVGVGVALRLLVPARVAMAPWAYTRVLISARLIYEGPLLARLSDGPVWLTDALHASTLVLAMLAPLAVYVHARYLLTSGRAALLAAGIVAVLPLHLRFSFSDVAFIPSITISSVTFALVHAAIREQHPAWRWVALGLCAFPVALTYLVRPLNLMYFPLLVATAFVNEGLYEDKAPPSWSRIGLVAALVSLVTFGVGVPALLASFSTQVAEGLSLETLRRGLGVLLDPRFNALVNPRFTPPGLLALALFGGLDLWRRGRRRLLGFLVVWLLGLLFAHAYVVPIEPMMQARYHLHLVVPFVLLAVAGLEALLEVATEARLGGRGRALVVGGALTYLAASPLVHLPFIRDVRFDEMREWAFVHALRDELPAGCTVLEHTGMGFDARMARVGAHRLAGQPRARFRVIPLQADDAGTRLSAEALEALRDPPSCLYFLQALPCVSAKPDELPLAPVCREVEGFLPAIPVAEASFPSRVYDGNYARHRGGVRQIELRLYRLGRPSEDGGAPLSSRP